MSRIPPPLKEELRRIRRADMRHTLTWQDVVALARDSKQEAMNNKELESESATTTKTDPPRI